MSTPGPQRQREASRVWAITAVGVLAVLACLALGAWQLDRARTRDTPTTPGNPMDTAAVPLAEAVPADGRVNPGAAPLAVTVTGRYDGDHQVLVPGRDQGGTPATYVVTPLVPADGRAVLVVRGWIPVDSGPAEPTLPPPAGDVTVTGWLVPSEPLDAGTADPLDLPAGQVPSVTAARVAGLVPYPIVDGYVGLVDEKAGASRPVVAEGLTPLTVPQITSSVHWSVQSLFYAIEWWFFALVVIWMCVQAVGIERRRLAEDVRADAGQAADEAPVVPPAP